MRCIIHEILKAEDKEWYMCKRCLKEGRQIYDTLMINIGTDEKPIYKRLKEVVEREI